MKRIDFSGFKRLSFALCLAVALTGMGSLAQAQMPPTTPAGCNPTVMDAMQKTAQAKVAYDVARSEQVFPQPDSVLAMTCFDKAAGVSAARGGDLFSGSFSYGPFSSVITDALNAFYSQFSDSEGAQNNAVNYNQVGYLPNDASCNGIGSFWDRIRQKGLEGGIPYMTMADMLTGSVPSGAGPRFQHNWNTSAGDQIFSDVQNAYTNLPRPVVPDFTNATTVCDVLRTAGNAPANCN
jgi:hypothetical protein